MEYVLLVSAIIPNAINLICNIPLFMGKLPYAGTRSEGGAMVPVAIQGYGSSGGIFHDIGEENQSVDLYSSSEIDTLI